MPSQDPVRSIPAQPAGADRAKVVDLLCQALQCDVGAVAVYGAAVRSAQASALRTHWEANLARANDRARILGEALAALGIAADLETPGRAAVRRLQDSAVASMEDGRTDAPLDAAQIIAADCVVAIEARTEAAWGLIRILAKALLGERGKVLRRACEAVDQGPRVKGRTDAWAHELWLQAIGLPPSPAATPSQSLRAA